MDQARPRTSEPLLVEAEHPEVGRERAPPSIIVDVSSLEPGREVVVVDRNPFSGTSFVVRHNGEYVLVQV